MLKLVLTITLIFHSSLNSNSQTKSNSSQSLNSNLVGGNTRFKDYVAQNFLDLSKKTAMLKIAQIKTVYKLKDGKSSIKNNALELYIIPKVQYFLMRFKGHQVYFLIKSQLTIYLYFTKKYTYYLFSATKVYSVSQNCVLAEGWKIKNCIQVRQYVIIAAILYFKKFDLQFCSIM